ncbi:MAG TPA: T9SS type A sorting domain-containing protein, partial [Pelobium sp.]|nr:T9SS type A sorting domain-containing protein [Pelobium sp.]
YTDYNALNGTNYYQLQQVDNDGQTESFEVIAVTQDNQITPLKVSAIPSQQQLNVSFYTNKSGVGKIQVYNLNGSKITDFSHSFNKGHNLISFPFNAPQNIYNLRVQNENELKSVKFLFR